MTLPLPTENRRRQRGMMGFPGTPVADPQTAWRTAAAADNGGLRTLYIHIPFCRRRCLFCPFYFGSTDRAGMAEYVTLLGRELADAAPALNRYPINAVYFGGGTPTDLEPEDLAALLTLLHRHYRLANDCEITVEGRITGFDNDKIQACLDHGVNRFSLGVQTFDTALRRSLGRAADRNQVIARLQQLAMTNQAAVVIDLLYGLPGQTPEQWREDQRLILGEVPVSGLDHYRLRVHHRLPLAQKVAAGQLPSLPDETACWTMYRDGEELMAAAGAVRLSIKHYALDSRERNLNNDISGRKHICLPFGIHAGGRLGDYRFAQTDDPAEYRRAVTAGRKPLAAAEQLPPDFPVAAVLAGQISRQRRLNLVPAAATAAADRHHRILELGNAVLEQWREKGWLLPERHGWSGLTSRGMFMHPQLGTELMEKVAQAWEKES
ncbi:MAG: radical SAM protein [Victivallales bacterium]|nr:radical SAM protein [Victivallales bacterium]